MVIIMNLNGCYVMIKNNSKQEELNAQKEETTTE